MIRVLMIVLPLLLVLGRMVTAAPMDGGNTAPAQVKSLRVGSADDRLRLDMIRFTLGCILWPFNIAATFIRSVYDEFVHEPIAT